MEEAYIEMKLRAIEDRLSSLNMTSHQYVLVRFSMVICFCLSFYQGFEHERPLFIGICVLLFVLFILIVKKHQIIKEAIEDEESLKEVYLDILKRKSDEWKAFMDDGHEFMEDSFTQAYDLDLLGKASLFQYLNVAQTKAGKIALKDALLAQDITKDEILKRQQAISELITQSDLSVHFMQLSKAFKKHAHKNKKMDQEIDALLTSHLDMHPMLLYLCNAVSILTWIGAILWLLKLRSYLLFSIGFTLSLCLSLLFSLKHQSYFQYVGKIHTLMYDYRRFFDLLSSSTFQSEKLQQLQDDTKSSRKAFKSLNWLLGFVQARNNIIFNVLLNGFFLIDFHCMYQFSKFAKRYGTLMPTWFDAIGQLEMLLSLAQISFAKEHACFPKINDQKSPTCKGQGFHHPLLNEQKVVKNDVMIASGSYVITGSNMSGKTTFLRTIGINLVLAKAGAMVCADAMQTSIMRLYTSMRVKDDVSEGISTFYAEILRIKQMMMESKQEVAMMVLIDEIFKGTNSADRIACAMQAIRRLHLPWVIALVSTHDFELCQLAKDSQIQAVNYHFEEYYENDHIGFDYKLKPGRSTSTNAQQLMRMAGFYD